MTHAELEQIANALSNAESVIWTRRNRKGAKWMKEAIQALADSLCVIQGNMGCPDYHCALGVRACMDHTSERVVSSYEAASPDARDFQ